VIVVLSYAQLNAARHWGTARHKQHLIANRERTKAGHAVAMPAIGWKTLAERMENNVFYASSGRHRKTSNARDGVPASRKALKKIITALNQVTMHPALRGEPQVGSFGLVLMVWPQGAKWSLYPVADQDPVFFVPIQEHHSTLGVITWWRPQAECPADLPDLFPDPSDHAGWLVGGHDVVGVAEDHRGA